MDLPDKQLDQRADVSICEISRQIEVERDAQLKGTSL